MTPTLVFDLETVPDVAGLRRLHGHDAAVSDQEVAERAFAQRREKTGSDFLPHHLHRIIAIGCVFRDDSGLRVRCLRDGTDDEESRLIGDFFRIIDRYTPQLVSWNGGGFDLPVLHYRGLVHAVTAPRYWELGNEDRDFKWNSYIGRYHTRHIDLMDLLSLYQPRAAAPLDELARLCGLPGKLGMDGSQVWPAVQAGQLAAVRAYCETDVMNTWLVYCRWQLMRGEIDATAYQHEMTLARDTLRAIDAPHWREYLAAWRD
jgi:3'-5' exonuclease